MDNLFTDSLHPLQIILDSSDSIGQISEKREKKFSWKFHNPTDRNLHYKQVPRDSLSKNFVRNAYSRVTSLKQLSVAEFSGK